MAFWHTKLHYRLMVSFVIILLLPVLSLSFYFSRQLSTALRAEARLRYQQLAYDNIRRAEIDPSMRDESQLSSLLDQLADLFMKNMPSGVGLTIVDQAGNLIHHRPEVHSKAFNTLSDLLPDSAAVLMRDERAALYGPPDGRDALWVAERLIVRGAIQWTVIYQVPLAMIERPIVESRLAVAALSGGLMILTLLFSNWAAQRIASPIRQLAEATQRMESGDWHTPVPALNNRDEIGTLSRAMSRMASAIQSLVADLRARVHDLEETRTLLMRRADELEALRQIALASSSSLNQDQMLTRMLDKLATLVPYTSASVILYDGQALRFAAKRGMPDDVDWSKAEAALTYSVKTRDYVRSRQIIIYADVRQEDSWLCLDPKLDYIRSWMGVPLLYRDRLIGHLNLDHEQENFYTIEHAALANAVGQQMALALENARLFSQMEYAVKERTAELRDEQERLLTIVENVTDAIMFTDERGRLLYVNPSWRALNGYDLTQALRLGPWALQERLAAPQPELLDALRQGLPWHGELKLRRRDGMPYDAHMTVVPVRAEDEALRYFVSVERDITEAKELEALKARFVADAAHDLRNPISVLMTSLYILSRAPAQLSQRLPILEYQVNRLSALINDLLTVARLDRDKELSEVAPIDIGFLTTQVCQSQATLAQSKAIRFNYSISPNQSLILGDVQQVERVIVNLIANALAYTPQGGKVSVRVEVDGSQVMLEVEDTGIGIAADEQQYIFERFYRAKNARATDGTGLGLAIVKEVVARHKGRIELYSVLGQGTRFRVFFPLYNNPAPAPQREDEASSGA
ncbi:MAG: ATP-binding protein [Anaerolineae bacterium]|nr:ATP-binding protein [Anaerolineae bacterium]MDW8173612.1 ATP-binding protein [Anaerolineae bacterium]